jgi:hypothetical protein
VGAGTHCITEFEDAGSDDQIPKAKLDAFSPLLAADSGNDLRRDFRDRIDRSRSLEFIEESPPLLKHLGRIGAIDPVGDFRNREGGERWGCRQ